MNFNEAWDYIVKRSENASIPVVQERAELEYIFNLMKDCKSYLEVGTAEGNSLYVLANAMPKGSFGCFVDLGEKHTEQHREEILSLLKEYDITGVFGDSTFLDTYNRVATKIGRIADYINNFGTVDCVLIDGGHDFATVLSDAILYSKLSHKYVIFHDIQLPDVNRAYEWYCRRRPKCKNYRIVNSETYGYGIIECTQ